MLKSTFEFLLIMETIKNNYCECFQKTLKSQVNRKLNADASTFFSHSFKNKEKIICFSLRFVYSVDLV